jgi:hypothetical protein
MRRIGVLGICLAAAASELTEVTLNPGDRTIVVQGVLNRDRQDQFVILEYSFNGDTVGRAAGRREIPPGKPQFPIDGAKVTLSYPGPGPCSGRIDSLRERPPSGSPSTPSGVYGGVPCPLQPGERAVLQVVTKEGEVVTAGTVMPGISNPRVTDGQGTYHPGRSAQPGDQRAGAVPV